MFFLNNGGDKIKLLIYFNYNSVLNLIVNIKFKILIKAGFKFIII